MADERRGGSRQGRATGEAAWRVGHRSRERGRPWRRPGRAHRRRRHDGARARVRASGKGQDPAPAWRRRPLRPRRTAGTGPSAPAAGSGPYAVDRRDEETRERAEHPRGRRRPLGERSARAPDRRQAHRAATTSPRQSRRAQPSAPTRRRRKRGPADVQQEMAKVAGRNANRALGTLMAAADAFAHDRERETLRILRPLREQLPDSPSVRELTGLAQYRIGNYAAAAKELEAYADLSDSVDQNPVLMDCYRAQRRWRKVEELWLELAAVSPSAELVAEGRIVYAGALADQGRLPEALALLREAGRTGEDPEGAPPPALVRARRPRGAGRQPGPGPRALPPGATRRSRLRRRRRAPRHARMRA